MNATQDYYAGPSLELLFQLFYTIMIARRALIIWLFQIQLT